MWRAVIADDEQVILNGLKKLVDWRALGVEIVGDALDLSLIHIYWHRWPHQRLFRKNIPLRRRWRRCRNRLLRSA